MITLTLEELAEILLLGHADYCSPGEDLRRKVPKLMTVYLPLCEGKTLHTEGNRVWRWTYWQRKQRGQEVLREEVKAAHFTQQVKKARIALLAAAIRRAMSLPHTDNQSVVLAHQAIKLDVPYAVQFLSAFGIPAESTKEALTMEINNPEDYV